MATVAEFTVAADEFPLGSIFEPFPAASVELERIIPTNHALVPYFWVRGAPTDSVAAAFRDHPAVDGITVVDAVDEDTLLRANWDEEADGVLKGVIESGLTLLTAAGNADRWHFEVRATDRAAVAAFQAYCTGQGISVAFDRLSPLASATAEQTLTAEQREAFVAAFRAGYYDEPRGASLAEIAADLGISRQALAGRLRRGHRHLVAEALAGG